MLQPSTPRKEPSPQVRRGSLIISATIALMVFLLLLGASESLVRFGKINGNSALSSMGVYHTQFEIKWFKLQDFVRENGGVDVLLIGNSMVNTGIDPDVLASEFETLTGKKLRIFNFGVEGLTVAPNASITGLLVELYHPGTILFVTEMRDYAAKNGLEVEQRLLSDEWLASQLGASPQTLTARLKSSFVMLPYILAYRNWSRADFLDNTLVSYRRFGDTSPAGYEADLNTGKNVSRVPDPENPKDRDDFELFQDYFINPGRLENLKKIISSTSEGTTVFVTEMPVLPTYFAYFGGEGAHQAYLSILVPFVQENGGIFLPALSWELIPLDNRVDHHHLNYKGAPRFSRLLAEQLAVLCLKQNTCLKSYDSQEVAK